MIKRHLKLIIFLIILIVLIVCGIIFIPKIIGGGSSDEGRVQRTSTVALTKMDLTESVSATGTIESASTTTVAADVQNVTVKSVLVEVGDTVVKGQKMVTFDKSELKKALKEAEQDYSDTVSQSSQELSQAYQQLSQARAAYASDKKRLTKIVNQAKKALKKARKAAKKSSGSKSTSESTSDTLQTGKSQVSAPIGSNNPPTGGNGTGSGNDGAGSGSVGDPGSGTGSGSGTGTGTGSSGGTQVTDVVITDDMTVSEAKAALKQAKENLASANRQNLQSIRQAEQAVSQAQSNNQKSIRQAKQSVQDAKDTLKTASIKATMDGTVTALGVEAGQIYNGSDAVEISDLTSFKVSTSVDEYDINKIEKGQRVVILTDATGDEEIEGEITYVALTTGSSSLSGGSGMGGDSGSMGGSSSSSGYEVTVTLNPTDVGIRSGMTAKCSIIIEEAADVYAVPYDAIHTNNNNEDVIYVMDSSGTRKEIVVEKGMESDYYVEVSSSELNDDMSVIIPTDEVSTGSSDDSSDSSSGFGIFGGGNGGGRGGDSGGNMGGGGPSGNMVGGNGGPGGGMGAPPG